MHCSASPLTIRVRILLNPVKNENKQKEAGVGPFKKHSPLFCRLLSEGEGTTPVTALSPPPMPQTDESEDLGEEEVGVELNGQRWWHPVYSGHFGYQRSAVRIQSSAFIMYILSTVWNRRKYRKEAENGTFLENYRKNVF